MRRLPLFILLAFAINLSLVCSCKRASETPAAGQEIPNLIDSARIASDGAAIRAQKKLIAFDLDATLTRHRTALCPENRALLDTLGKLYDLVMVCAGNCQRVFDQMEHYPIDIVGNYGMQVATVENGELKYLKDLKEPADTAFFLEKTGYLRQKYGYTEYKGEPVEFHESGMVTFGLLGKDADIEDKLVFDPDKSKRTAMYPEVLEIFNEYSVFIGGSTSFDFALKEFNKYDATLSYAKEKGYTLDQILFIGDDFTDGGGDSHVRVKGMDFVWIKDYTRTPEVLGFLWNY